MESASKSMTHVLAPDLPINAVYELTPIDAGLPHMFVRMMVVYDAPKATTKDEDALVDALRDSLRSMLRLPAANGKRVYPHLLGKVVYKDDDRVEVRVQSGDEVQFIVRREEGNAVEIEDWNTGYLDGAAFTPLPMESEPDQQGHEKVFAGQVTFVGGLGFVIGIAIHHAVADASAVGGVMKCWVRGAKAILRPSAGVLSVSHEDVLDRSGLFSEFRPKAEEKDHPELTVLQPSTEKPAFAAGEAPVAFQMPPMDTHLFHFSPSSLSMLKGSAGTASSPSEWISTNDALSTLLWRCTTRARFAGRADVDKSSHTVKLGVVTNCRSSLDPPLPEDYFGNCTFLAATVGIPIAQLLAVEHSTMADISRDVRRAVATTRSDKHCRSVLRLTSKQPKPTCVRPSFQTFLGDGFLINSWENVFNNRDEIDIGLGRVKAVGVPKLAFDGMAVTLPALGERDAKGGGLNVLVGLRRDHMDVLVRDEEFRTYAEWDGR